MNPFSTGSRQSSNSATAPRNSVNEPHTYNRLTHNTFDRSYDFYNTERYGDVTPFYVDEMVPGDKNPLYSTHELKTYTLQSPLMTGISKKKGYFAVPYKAMLPLNYDKIFAQPKKGDDVPVLSNTCFNISDINWRTFITSFITPNTFEELTHRFKFILLIEMFFSSGSLIHMLGCKLGASMFFQSSSFANKWTIDERISFDSWFDHTFSEFFRDFGIAINCPSIGENGSYFRTYGPYTDVPNPDGVKVSSRRLLELMRENPDFVVTNIVDSNGVAGIQTESVLAFFQRVKDELNNCYVTFGNTDRPFNYQRVLAYQLSHCVFFSNDDVDNIYTANLFRQNILSLLNLDLSSDFNYFSYNGVKTQYDVLSGAVIGPILADVLYILSASASASNVNYDSVNSRYCAFSEIFSIKQSLRFSDYYSGARINPLAVGDINAPVVNDGVSAIDMTQNIQVQRFLNFVNKIPSQISAYLRETFNVQPAVDLTEPSYLAVTKSNISGFEIENTADLNQGKRVVNLHSNDGNFAFEVDIADPCIVIGLSWYEMPRIYSSIVERQWFHEDRMDMFQPMLQYIGDQPIYRAELNSRLAYSEPFAYTLRNMEYKQRVHQASGGFVENLSSWANVVDNNENDNEDVITYELDPYFIRARNYEFDRYFSSLTGFSLGSYFHFIVRYSNKNNITRPMAVSPQILG